LHQDCSERMENTNLRIPRDLREIAEKRADEAGWTLTEELRYALELHYQKKTTFVTMAVLEQMLKAHELKFHQSGVIILPPLDVENSENTADATEKERPPKVLILEVLSGLLASLHDGEEPTPGQISRDLKIDPKTVGRILRPLGIVARHTTINGVPGRYYLKELLPKVESAYARLRQ
jgi:hypothetical protein